MEKQNHSEYIQHNNPQSAEGQTGEVILWEQYCQKLSCIAGIYSDSYWAKESLAMLQNQQELGLLSKTKQALSLLNEPNSKIDLMNKILKNLTQCRRIEQNQEKLVHKLIQIDKEWDKWKSAHLAKLHLQQSFDLLNSGEDFPQKIDTFEANFDNDKLQRFQEQYDLKNQDVQI